MRVEIISFLRIFDDPLERSRDFSLVGVGLAGFLSGASTARSKASSLAFEGRLKPLSLRTNCSDEARISSSVAGGLKL